MATQLKIGFIGAGKMATALGKGFVQAGLVGVKDVLASDPMDSARAKFAAEVGCPVTDSNVEVFRFANLILLAVKPDHVDEVLSQGREHLTSEHRVISIAAGISLARLEAALNPGARVIRVMPNTPALVGAAAAAYALGKGATPEDGHLARQLFSAVGVACEVKESWLDAVTGLSGSGPAFVFLMIEALSDGAVAAGLPRDLATRLAAQTVLGSAKLVLESGIHPGALKDMVTSPGGTTIEGVQELERGGVRAAFMQAVRAAAEKSRRLGQR